MYRKKPASAGQAAALEALRPPETQNRPWLTAPLAPEAGVGFQPVIVRGQPLPRNYAKAPESPWDCGPRGSLGITRDARLEGSS